MIFFKKKKVIININSKFKLGQEVRFKYYNDSYIGLIRSVRLKNDKVVYDIIVGGECPFEALGVEEVDVNLYIQKRFL